MLCSRELTKGNSEVVCVVESVQKVLVCVSTGQNWVCTRSLRLLPEELLTEWMYVLQAGKPLENGGQLLGERLLRIFDLAGVECCNHISPVPADMCHVGLPLILLILKPARICVGRRRWVRLKTMSRNSWLVGTGCISFHVVFIFATFPAAGVRTSRREVSRCASHK